jgi:hypothetical protein
MKDPAANGRISQENWMMDAGNSGETDPSERPEAQYPIIQKNWTLNEQASGRPIDRIRASLRFKSLPLSILKYIISI